MDQLLLIAIIQKDDGMFHANPKQISKLPE